MNRISRRDYFAAEALQGLLSNAKEMRHEWGGELTPEFWAKIAVKHAEALVKELDKNGPPPPFPPLL